MHRVLVADDSGRDAENFRAVIEAAGLKAVLCRSGEEAARHLEDKEKDWAALIILWDIPGPPFGFELLARCRLLLPGVPIVVISGALDASLAARAYGLGAKDFLQKPLDLQRVKSCLNALINQHDPYLPMVEELNKIIKGQSPALLSALKQVAKVIRHKTSRVLLIGDSGTGKELVAHAIHDLGSAATKPFVAVNVAALPKELIESALFGHEKGAFTGATEQHQGYMEEAGAGTLFLDEMGELDMSLQAKLLRVIQEKKFRRLKGKKEIDFRARLVCATNRDLALEVKRGTFRQDLFHRIAEVTVHIPPLSERSGDIDSLLEHFLSSYAGEREVYFERETLTILNSYHFPGNVRELENIVKTALIGCDGELILPEHLPLSTMGTFLAQDDRATKTDDKAAKTEDRPAKADDWATKAAAAAGLNPSEEQKNGAAATQVDVHQELFQELVRALPENWRDLSYKDVRKIYGSALDRALDRIYLPGLIKRYRYNVTKAAKAAGVDKKTFTQHWKNAGLGPLRDEEGEPRESSDMETFELAVSLRAEEGETS